MILNDKLIKIDNMKCLRAEYYYNECSKCIDICPEKSITLGENKRIRIDDKCPITFQRISIVVLDYSFSLFNNLEALANLFL